MKARIVSCALFGAFIAGATAIVKLLFSGHVNVKVPLAAGLLGCANSVANPKIQRFLNRHEFSFED